MPLHSAILPAYGSRSIHANHMDMTKFEFADDPGFLDVSTTLWRWSRDLSNETVTSSIVSQVSQSQATLPAIEDGVLHEETIPRSMNSFYGQNNTGGGRVFQGSIVGKGNVNVG